MMNKDQVKGKAGEVKEEIGKKTDSEETRAEGQSRSG